MNIEQLPGGELILQGLEDLQNGEMDTVGSLLIAIAATRLTEAGLDFPRQNLCPEPELTLYAQLEEERPLDAYPYYNALLARLNSFCHALEMFQKYSNPN
jgi:hypothetical protein